MCSILAGHIDLGLGLPRCMLRLISTMMLRPRATARAMSLPISKTPWVDLMGAYSNFGWWLVGSGAGAVALVGVPFPAPATSNRACGFPAHGSPTSFTAGIRPCPPVPEGTRSDDGSTEPDQGVLVR